MDLQPLNYCHVEDNISHGSVIKEFGCKNFDKLIENEIK